MYAVDSDGCIVPDSPDEWDDERAAFESFLNEIEPDEDFASVLQIILVVEGIPEPKHSLVGI